MIHLVLLPSFRSLKAVMHSGTTETLEDACQLRRARGKRRGCGERLRWKIVEDRSAGGERTLIAPEITMVSEVVPRNAAVSDLLTILSI